MQCVCAQIVLVSYLDAAAIGGSHTRATRVSIFVLAANKTWYINIWGGPIANELSLNLLRTNNDRPRF